MKTKAILALLLSSFILMPALAQTMPAAAPPPPQQPQQQQQKPGDDRDDVVRITTNLVQVDAVVTKNGKPVTNLTADDFEIYEDGKKQTITSFAYISNVPSTTTAAQTVAKSGERDRDPVPFTRLKRDAPRRTVAMVVDDLGLSAESIYQVRRQLRKFIVEELQPNDLVAIIRTSGEVGALQQFTNDRRVLTRAVDQLKWNPCSRVGINLFPAHPGLPMQSPLRTIDVGESPCSYGAYGSTMKTLRFVLDAMGELPGRKSMVVLSDSMPSESQELLINYTQQPVIDNGLIPANTTLPNSFSYAGFLHKIAEKAIRSSVVIYSVDTQGLPTLGITAADSFSGNFRDVTSQMNAVMSQRSLLASNRRAGGEMIARQTGGFQVRNSNNFQLDRVLEDQSGYYLLGYRPTDETFNRRFHHIKAKAKQKGMTLRTRFGFFGVTEEEANKGRRSVSDMTNLALMSPFGAQDINVDMTSFFASDKAGGSVIRSFIYLDAKDMTFTPEAGRQLGSFELHGVVFGDNGAVVEHTRRGATISLSQEEYEQARRNGMGLTFDIPVKRPGAFQVRIAARDRISSRIGSAGQFVAVPNLKNKKLAVSGVVLGTGSDSTGKDLTNPGVRRFTANANVYFAYMLFNATNESGALRNLVMQTKLFRDGKPVWTGPETAITAGNQPDQSRLFASGMVRLPSDLEPGNYYLQVLVMESGPKNKSLSVVQWADFEVEKQPEQDSIKPKS